MHHPKSAVGYLEIAEFLIEKIKNQDLTQGEKIPSENSLRDQFKVNRHVVRQAIARITNLGWVTPEQGKGAYVNAIPKPIPYVLSANTRFTNNMEKLGKKHKGKLIEWSKTKPSPTECEQLKLSNGDQVYRLEILRYVDENPISITTSIFPENEVPLLESYLENFHSLYEILRKYYQFLPIRERSMFQAVLPSLSDATHLQTPENVPVLNIESLMNHPNGIPIEYSVARIRGDMHKCLVEF
jgi:DNA-binding GntR family transcriptional regulator